MKISRKKTVGLMLLFVMLISAIMPTMATALTYSLSDGSIINSYNVTTDVVTLYIGNVSKDGTSQFRYLYTDKAVNAATLTEIGKILTSDYSGLLPTTEGQVKACSDSTIEVQDFFTDAGVVAAAKYPSGTTQDTSGTILYNQTEFNTLVANSQTEISEESAAESTNLTEWNGRKTAWEADPDNAGIDFPEEYVKAFNDPTVYPAEYFIADSKGTANTSAIIRDGSAVDVHTYPIDRTIIKVVNTSANVEATSTVSNVVSNLEELQAALNNDALTEVIVNNAMTLPNGTSLDGKGKTVRVEKPYVKEDGTLEESPSSGNVFDVGSGSEVTIKNMTIMGGQKNSSGAISSNGQLTLENVNIVRSNRGLDHYGGVSILKNCNFSLNVCKSAGAIWCGNGAKLILDGCSFTQNRSNGGSGMGGGAIGLSSGYLYANNTIFANNATQEIGGAINIYGGNAYLMNCTVAGNCSSGGNEYYGGGIGKNGGVFHAVNSVFIDNYAKVSGDKARSDIGIYSGSDGSLNNCVYSKMQGSMSSTPNCKIDESNATASSYTDTGIMLSDGTISTSFSHPVLTAGTNPISKYVIIKASGNAATGGTLTYFDYSDKTNIKMGYGNDTSITALGGLSVPTSDKKVASYYEGGTRIYGVIGASGADGEITPETTSVAVGTTVGGKWSCSQVDASNMTGPLNATVDVGKTLTFTATADSGYRFVGWYEGVIGSSYFVDDNTNTLISSETSFTTTITGPLIIRAVFEAIPVYTVQFIDGGTVLSTQQVAEGDFVTKPTTNPTKEGYAFDDWCLDSTLTTKFVFETTPITTNTPIYARWKLLPKVLGESVWRNGSTATLRFNSNVTGTYYYDVKDSNTPPTADEIKSSLSVNSGNDSAIIGTNALDLTGISSGAKYVYVVVEQDNVFSNVLTIEMPYDSYFSDNYDSYASNTRISGLDSYSLQYNGTGTGNQIIISSEQKDGSTGNVLQLQGANSWASDVRHNFTPDSKQYVIFEANMKPVSGTDPGGVNFGSSSAGGYWTGSVCRAGLGLNNALYYGKNDISDDCDTDLTYSNGNWYNLKMILDNTNDLYYIFFDNQCVETIPYEADSATPEWFSLGGGNNGTNTIYYDDVKVYTTDTVEIPTPSYRIYVNSGTSSPSPRAEENTTVTITADEPSNGSEFYRWNVISGGITLANDTSATTTFTMGTERVEVTALYKFVIPDQITYELRDSYGDGWHGNNKINIVDTSNNNTVESLTMSGSSLNGITQNLEPGHIYDLYWQKGSYPGECSFTLKDKDGNVLITRSGDDNASKEGVFLTVQVAEPTYYTVRFMDGETELSSEQVVEGGRVASPTTNPSKTNHIFLGWYADAALATEFDFDNTAITADTQIYAGFVKQGIFVYYNAGDGNGGTVFSNMINAGDTYNVRAFDSLTTFSAPSGKHFAGWNVSDGSQITKAQLESNPAKVINQIGNSATASITFTAYYEDDVYYTVSFMDGTNTISSQTILEGQKATRPTSDPTKANHEFVNWYADSTLTTVFNFNTPISRDMCIYAKFNPVYHDVTIPLSDGLVIPSGGGTFTEEQTLGIEFLASKGIVICEEDDAAHVERWYTADRKLLFTFDENTKTIHFADGVSYKDNINYVLTDADKTLLAGYGAYINTITLNFGNAPFEYVILEGANQTHTVNQDGSLTVKANGDISKFVKLLVDRIEVAEKDRTIVSGSTVATLNKEFLDTLSEGTHELTFVYTDGEVSTNFTIARVSMPTQTGGDVGTPVAGTPVQLLSKSPITGDNIILWTILLIISVNGLIATEVYIRKVFKK